MPSPDSYGFTRKMLSLNSLYDWNVPAVLKQVRAAGYRGPPSIPIEFYRKSLSRIMKEMEPKEGERYNETFLRAEQAYNASMVFSNATLNMVRDVYYITLGDI